MREEELRVAARAVVDVLDLVDSHGAKLLLGDRAQVQHPSGGDAVVGGERIQALLAALVAALADAGADGRPESRGGCGAVDLHPRRSLRDHPAGEATPAAVEHR